VTELVVQLSPEAAKAFSDKGVHEAPVNAVLDEHGVTLKPINPDIDDPVLSTYFRATVPSSGVGEKVVSRLQKLPSVAAAYLKPSIGLP
jgi:hypothetical protein